MLCDCCETFMSNDEKDFNHYDKERYCNDCYIEHWLINCENCQIQKHIKDIKTIEIANVTYSLCQECYQETKIVFQDE